MGTYIFKTCLPATAAPSNHQPSSNGKKEHWKPWIGHQNQARRLRSRPVVRVPRCRHPALQPRVREVYDAGAVGPDLAQRRGRRGVGRWRRWRRSQRGILCRFSRWGSLPRIEPCEGLHPGPGTGTPARLSWVGRGCAIGNQLVVVGNLRSASSPPKRLGWSIWAPISTDPAEPEPLAPPQQQETGAAR